MSVLTKRLPKPRRLELLESDGEPLESAWHVTAMFLLFESTRCHFQRRHGTYYCAVNMFVYYDPKQAEAVRREVERELAGEVVRRRAYRGPDYFFVDNVDGTHERRYWVVWEENNRFPEVIIELSSPKTARTDRTTKKRIYEQIFRTPEYFCYDPRTQCCEGWRLASTGRYRQIKPDANGRLWSEVLQLWLGPWRGSYLKEPGTYLRFFTPDGEVTPTFGEAAEQQAAAEQRRADDEHRRADDEHRRADDEHRRADDEHRRADDEHRRAEMERLRANAAEEELARLKAQLANTAGKPPANGKKNGKP